MTGPKAPTRATESSTRRAMGRSPIRNASATPRQPVECVLLVVGDGLAGAVGAGHHQHLGRAGSEQQMMQRRVGKHDAELVVVGSDARQLDLGFGQDDRARRGCQQRLRLRRQLDESSVRRPTSLTITANGFSLRYFRSRIAFTAAALRASQAR